MKNRHNRTIWNIINEDDNYVRVHNDTAADKKLSWKARGILTFLLSRPKDWKTYMSEVVKHSPGGIASLYSGIKELEKHGYIKKRRTYDAETKKIDGIEYFVYGNPKLQSGFIDVGNKDAGNHTLLKTNKKKKTNTNVGDRNRRLINNTSPYDKIAIKLKKVIDIKYPLHKIKHSTYVRELNNISIKGNYTKKEVKTVYRWYIKNIDDKYTPQIRKANDLYDRFTRIKDAMDRSVNDSTNTTEIKVSEQAEKITSHLFDLGSWPGDEDVIEKAVQLSIDNYKLFLKQHKKLLKKLKVKVSKPKRDIKSSQLLRFVKYINNDTLLDVCWFVEHEWFTKLHGLLQSRTNANINNYVFTIEQPHFDKLGCRWANEYTSSSRVWTAYKKELSKI